MYMPVYHKNDRYLENRYVNTDWSTNLTKSIMLSVCAEHKNLLIKWSKICKTNATLITHCTKSRETQ